MTPTKIQELCVIHALKDDYLRQLFIERQNTYVTHNGCFLLAEALNRSIGGDLYTMYGTYMVTNATTDWHIFVKRGDTFWDADGQHSLEELKEIWVEDNLVNIDLRPFQTDDLSTIALDKSSPLIPGNDRGRFFEVLHGEQYEKFLQEVTQYFDLMKEGKYQSIDLCIWPSGDVCKLSDIENFNWKNDDYTIQAMPAGLDPEVFAESYLSQVQQEASMHFNDIRSNPLIGLEAPDF